MIVRPDVLLDVDGVLADFVAKYLDDLYALTGVRHTKAEVNDWEIKNALNLSKEVELRMVAKIEEEGWCYNIPILPDAQEGVQALREIANVHIVTSPWWSSTYWAGERYRWLKDHFNFSYKEVTQTHSKHKMHGDYLVDDKHGTLVKWKEAHSEGVPILWGTPHNINDDATWRVNSWDQLLQMVSMWEPRGL